MCRACEELITHPADGAIAAQELGNSGPDWDTWAHREHAEDIEPIDPDLPRITTRIRAAHSPA
ncbi:hypothetical protein EJ357_00505 [Streptomyces cyaneochromogenes]|uniref:Uncharacterized protein n=1 Tax=Streptomyces cyaneochromogenes TaxID=2496836 RepID=A0A3Q9F0C4_9ACTN|nr:hypothetical protein EJ357_00505 [Streptomyces cyaneochromogenes]